MKPAYFQPMKLCGCLVLFLVGWLGLAKGADVTAPVPAPVANGSVLSEGQLDALLDRACQTLDVPGLAVAIVKDGQVVYLKGRGVRSIKTRQPVDAQTLFGIASNSKAFTAAALGILVDEGKVKWDDKVVHYLPEFQWSDPFVTAELTIRDLLTHRSGLGMAGNLMQSLTPNSFTVADIIHGLRYLKPAASFRSKYAYDNLLYIVAGELVARVSGMAWGDFIQKRIFTPLAMTQSAASYRLAKNNANIIDGHRTLDGKLVTVERNETGNDAGAGGIYASAADLSKWMLMHLNHGKYGPVLDKSLFSPNVQKEQWAPQTIIPVGKNGLYNTHFGAYGLGWFLVDVKGYLEVFHTGEDEGMVSEVAMIPELQLGIAVLANQEDGDAPGAIVNQILDGYLGLAGTDRVGDAVQRIRPQNKPGDEVAAKVWQEVARQSLKAATPGELAAYTGVYRDNWFGDARLTMVDGKLWFASVKSPLLTGSLLPYQGSTFVVKWQNPRIDVDVFLIFSRDAQDRVTGLMMKPVSVATPAAFDFQDLDFQRVMEP